MYLYNRCLTIICLVLTLFGCADDPLPLPSSDINFRPAEGQEPALAVDYIQRGYRTSQALLSVQRITFDTLTPSIDLTGDKTLNCENRLAGGRYTTTNTDNFVSISDSPITETFTNCILTSNGMRVTGTVVTRITDIDGSNYTVNVDHQNLVITPALQTLSLTLNGSYSADIDIGGSSTQDATVQIERAFGYTVSSIVNGVTRTARINSGNSSITFRRSNDAYSILMSFSAIIAGELRVTVFIDGDFVSLRTADGDSNPDTYAIVIQSDNVRLPNFQDRPYTELSPSSEQQEISISGANANSVLGLTYNGIQALLLSQQIAVHTLNASPSLPVCSSGFNGGYSPSTPPVATDVIAQVFGSCTLRLVGHVLNTGQMVITVNSVNNSDPNNIVYDVNVNHTTVEFTPIVASNTSTSRYTLTGNYDALFSLALDGSYTVAIRNPSNYRVDFEQEEITFVDGTLNIQQSTADDDYEISLAATINIESGPGDLTFQTQSNLIGTTTNAPDRPVFPYISGAYRVISPDTDSVEANASDSDSNSLTYQRIIVDQGASVTTAGQLWGSL